MSETGGDGVHDQEGRKARLLQVDSVNNMVAIELRYKPIMSNGIGFYLYGAQVADFDDLEIQQ